MGRSVFAVSKLVQMKIAKQTNKQTRCKKLNISNEISDINQMGPALERGRHAQTALFCATANYWLSANNSTRPDHPQHILLFLQTIRVGNRCFCQGAFGQFEVGAQRVPSLLVKIWNNWKKIQGFSWFINLIFPPFDLPLFLLVESIMWESCHIWSRSGQADSPTCRLQFKFVMRSRKCYSEFCFSPDSAIGAWNSCMACPATWPGPIFHEGWQPHQKTKPPGIEIGIFFKPLVIKMLKILKTCPESGDNSAYVFTTLILGPLWTFNGGINVGLSRNFPDWSKKISLARGKESFDVIWSGRTKRSS